MIAQKLNEMTLGKVHDSLTKESKDNVINKNKTTYSHLRHYMTEVAIIITQKDKWFN